MKGLILFFVATFGLLFVGCQSPVNAQNQTATKLLVSADKSSVEADGVTQVTITAVTANENGVTVATSSSIVFTITSGSGTLSTSTVTAVNGIATVKFTPFSDSTNVITATTIGLTTGNVSVNSVVSTSDPKIVSVSNQGMRLVNVMFNYVVDTQSSETASNYIVRNNKGTAVAVFNAKLLSDRKTVQLFLDNGMFNDSIDDSIEVQNVQDGGQFSTMTTVIKTFTMSDISLPTVVAVEGLGTMAVRVTFSEALQSVSKSSLQIDGQNLANGDSVEYPSDNDYTKALIQFGSPLAVGAHTLTVGIGGNLQDWNVKTDGSVNANTMQPAGYVVTIQADTTFPLFSALSPKSQSLVYYRFSKAVKKPAANAFFWSTVPNTTSGTFASSVEKISDTEVLVTWSSKIPAGNIYFYAGTTSDKVVDFSGNSISPLPSSMMIQVVADTL